MNECRYRPNDDEARVARTVARIRNSLNGGGTNLPGGETATVEERERQHLRAALAEIAVARLSNRCWTGCGKGAESGVKDVGGVLEVRSVDEASRGLLARPKDKDGDPCVLVLVTANRWCEALGWEFYGTVKARGRALGVGTERPCWILPAGQLRPWRDWVGILEFIEQYELRESKRPARA